MSGSILYVRPSHSITTQYLCRLPTGALPFAFPAWTGTLGAALAGLGGLGKGQLAGSFGSMDSLASSGPLKFQRRGPPRGTPTSEGSTSTEKAFSSHSFTTTSTLFRMIGVNPGWAGEGRLERRRDIASAPTATTATTVMSHPRVGVMARPRKGGTATRMRQHNGPPSADPASGELKGTP
jgi:hypothetical protein